MLSSRAALRRSSNLCSVALSRRLADALLQGDEHAADLVVSAALGVGLTPAEIQSLVLAPAMGRVGELWALGRATIAQEQQATHTCARLCESLAAAMARSETPLREPRQVLLAAVVGQRHELGLRMIADVLGAAGFAVTNLGPDVEPTLLAEAAAALRPDVVGLAFGCTGDVEALRDGVEAVRAASPASRIMLGGRAVPPAMWSASMPRVRSSMEVVDVVLDLIDDPLPTRFGSSCPPPGFRAEQVAA